MEVRRGHRPEVLLVQRIRSLAGRLTVVVLSFDCVTETLLQGCEIDETDASVGFQALGIVVDLVRSALPRCQQRRALGGVSVDPV